MKTTSAALCAIGVSLLSGLASPGLGTAQVAGRALALEPQVRRVTLEEALSLLDGNFELRLARLRAAEAVGMARQSSAYPNPSVTVSYEDVGTSASGLSESYVTLSQRIEWPGARTARRAAAMEEAVAAGESVAADRALLAFWVKEAYVEAAYSERAVEILERVADVFRQAVRNGAARYGEGDISLYDLRRIEVERVRYEVSLGDARLNLGTARRRLARLLIPESAELDLAPADGITGVPPSLDLQVLLAQAVSRRREISGAAAAVRSALANADASRAQRIPELTAVGGFKRQSDGLSGLFLGVSVPAPIWSRSAGEIEAADARAGQAEARLALTHREVVDDARAAIAAYRSHLEQAAFLPGAEAAGGGDLLEIALVAYEAGEMELLELLDAAEAFRSAGITALDIRSDLWTSYYDLERAIGGAGAEEDE